MGPSRIPLPSPVRNARDLRIEGTDEWLPMAELTRRALLIMLIGAPLTGRTGPRPGSSPAEDVVEDNWWGNWADLLGQDWEDFFEFAASSGDLPSLTELVDFIADHNCHHEEWPDSFLARAVAPLYG